MVIHRPPTDFRFGWVVRVFSDGQFIPLTARVQSVQHIVEHLVQRDFAHEPSFRGTQQGQDMGLELILSYTRRDSAHSSLPLARFSSYDALSSTPSQKFQ